MCNCLKQKLFDLEYNKINMFDIKNKTFANFKSTIFSQDVDKQKYNSNISPRENIEIIKKICLRFVNNFDNPDEKNLLFTGNTGLGKTFLSNCIANELLKNNKTVLYQTAPIMMDMIIDAKMGKNNNSDLIKNILSVDLLIIDDLGTEGINSMKFSELFTILNSRLLNQNNKITKTIISTNLSLQNLSKIYGERITSRFVGNYNICYFFGDDLRFNKLK
jgi:DNA replication protein DnaC